MTQLVRILWCCDWGQQSACAGRACERAKLDHLLAWFSYFFLICWFIYDFFCCCSIPIFLSAIFLTLKDDLFGCSDDFKLCERPSNDEANFSTVQLAMYCNLQTWQQGATQGLFHCTFSEHLSAHVDASSLLLKLRPSVSLSAPLVPAFCLCVQGELWILL